MNHAGEIAPLVSAWCARTSRSSPRSRRCISNTSTTSRTIARAKAEIFARRRAGRRGDHQSRQPAFRRCSRGWRATAGVERIVGFGEHAEAEARLLDASSCKPSVLLRRGDDPRRARSPTSSARRAAIWCRTASRCLPRCRSLGADLAQAALALAGLAAPARGAASAIVLDRARRRGDADRRELQRQSGLDARGDRAARPDRAGRRRPAHRRPRRHAGARRRGRGHARRPRRAARRGRRRPASSWPGR